MSGCCICVSKDSTIASGPLWPAHAIQYQWVWLFAAWRGDVFCVICCTGPDGPAFRLPLQNLLPGLPVMMLGFPEASITDIKGLDSPVAAKGHINAIPTIPSLEVALADYHGGMFWSHCAEWSNAWRHAFLIHIGIAAAGSNREYVYITRLCVEVLLIDASCKDMYFA